MMSLTTNDAIDPQEQSRTIWNSGTQNSCKDAKTNYYYSTQKHTHIGFVLFFTVLVTVYIKHIK